jgi:hypothetical protein
MHTELTERLSENLGECDRLELETGIYAEVGEIEQHQPSREARRDLYFAVEDEESRKLLIGARRRYEKVILESVEINLAEASERLVESSKRPQRSPLGSFTAIVLVFAGVGYLIYGVLGAGLAALLGTFVAGRIVSAVWTVPMVESFENSLQDVADLKNHKAVCAATAESFGRVEELSGHRDQLLDHT